MENFYKITKVQADLLGRFEYEKNFSFDPYCSEQKDGTFLVSEEMYIKLKENSIIKKVDFTKSTKTSTLDTKEILIDEKAK